ncbi:MAG: alanine racemase [Actinomycetota bacterium]|nr:alanine racemase [Actinomycetota bacterium]
MAPGGAGGAFDVAAGLASVRERITAAGGDPGRVRVVAVTKGFGVDAVLAALAAGLEDIGENYAQELLAKDAALRAAQPEGQGAAGVRWHFLGAVQRNKVPALAPVVSCWQGVARSVEGEAIARRRPGAAVLVEVDTTGAPGRNGCAPDAVPALVADLGAGGLDVRGLMTVAPHADGDPRRAFGLVRALADGLGLPECSMGMSEDLELAVAEGSTMVRVGRALFGDRPRRRADAP